MYPLFSRRETWEACAASNDQTPTGERLHLKLSPQWSDV